MFSGSSRVYPPLLVCLARLSKPRAQLSELWLLLLAKAVPATLLLAAEVADNSESVEQHLSRGVLYYFPSRPPVADPPRQQLQPVQRRLSPGLLGLLLLGTW